MSAGIDFTTLAGMNLDALDMPRVPLAAVPDDAPEEEPNTWAPVDMTKVVNGEYRKVVPEIGKRSDGIPVLYRGKEHSVASEPEAGKTWWVALMVQEVLTGGGKVVYVDFEDDENTIGNRIMMAGALPQRLLDFSQWRYVRPERAPLPEQFEALLTFPDGGPDLVIFDGVTEGMSLLGLDIMNQGDAARWRRILIKPALIKGAATLATDHVVKDRDSRGRYAIGGQHKLAGLNGVQFLMENVSPFGVGLKGRSKIIVTKDRNGGLRQHGKPMPNKPGHTHVGDLVGDSENTEVPASWVFYPPYKEECDDSGDLPGVPGNVKAMARQILKVLEDSPGLSLNGIKQAVGGRGEKTAATVEFLTRAGLVRTERGARNSTLHFPAAASGAGEVPTTSAVAPVPSEGD